MNREFRLHPEEYKTEIVESRIIDLSNLLLSEKEIVFVIDENVATKNSKLLQNLEINPVYLYQASESSKSLETVQKIYRFLNSNNVKRNSVICAIGGGITTDLVAYCASTFKRGCRLWLVPTTVIAMVDAGIGGKTAVNHSNSKNLIGTFYPAEKVVYCHDFLDTLPLTEGLNGLYEILKMSFISDRIVIDSNVFMIGFSKELIKQTVTLKLSICENDLYDRGDRRKLNLGHTFAHLLEVVSDYQIPHGVAVAIGMRIALSISYKLELIDERIEKSIRTKLNKIPLTVFLDPNIISKIKDLGREILMTDKKATDSLNLILFKGANAEVTVYPISFSELIINSIIEEIEKLC